MFPRFLNIVVYCEWIKFNNNVELTFITLLDIFEAKFWNLHVGKVIIMMTYSWT